MLAFGDRARELNLRIEAEKQVLHPSFWYEYLLTEVSAEFFVLAVSQV
jgi:hypothetical protein